MSSKTIYKNVNGVNAEVTLVNPDTNFNKRTVELNSIMDKTPTIATLRAKTEIPETIYVTGYHSEGDGAFGSHFFRWNATSTEDDNGGTVIKLDGAETGRYELQYSGAVNVKWFGVDNSGNTDVSLLLNKIIDSYNHIKIGNGIYRASGIIVRSNKTIVTDGFNTTFTHFGSTGSTTRTFLIRGSNITIGKIKVIGAISTETNEQSHAVFIKGDEGVDCKNIKIESVYAKDIRGDAVYITQFAVDGTVTDDIQIGSVYCDNVLRNGVSITGGSNISITSITGDKVGLFMLDIEPESYGSKVIGVNVGYIKGRQIGSVSSSTTNYVDGVVIDTLILSPTYTGDSVPAYGFYKDDCLELRNTKNITIHTMDCNYANGSAIKMTYNTGEIGCENLNIGSLNIVNCARGIATDSCVAGGGLWNFKVDKLSSYIEDFTADATNSPATILIENVDNIQIGNIVSTHIPSGIKTFNAVTGNVSIISGSITGGVFSQARYSAKEFKVCGLTFDGERYASYSEGVLSENCTITTSVFVANSGFERVFFKNCIVNGEYCFNGIYIFLSGSYPTSGTWKVGDKVINRNTLTAGSPEGWVCSVAGAPGTWLKFGTISSL